MLAARKAIRDGRTRHPENNTKRGGSTGNEGTEIGELGRSVGLLNQHNDRSNNETLGHGGPAIHAATLGRFIAAKITEPRENSRRAAFSTKVHF